MSQRLLTPEEIAEMLSVTTRTVCDWLRSGRLRGVKAGRLWRVSREDLDTFLRRAAPDEPTGGEEGVGSA